MLDGVALLQPSGWWPALRGALLKQISLHSSSTGLSGYPIFSRRAQQPECRSRTSGLRDPFKVGALEVRSVVLKIQKARDVRGRVLVTMPLGF